MTYFSFGQGWDCNIEIVILKLSPRWYPYFDVVVGLARSHEPESYAGGSIATGRASHARQVKGDDPDKKGYPGPPGWGLGAGLTILSWKITNVAKNLMIETVLSSRERLGIQTNTAMRFGTWNVRTLLQAGNTNATADEAERYKMGVVALQEIRWKGRGLIKKSKFNLYHSGNEDRQGNRGVGFIVSKKINRSAYANA
jgi:hypothetical protein